MAPSVNVHVARHVDRRRRNVHIRTMVDTVLRVLEGRNRRFCGVERRERRRGQRRGRRPPVRPAGEEEEEEEEEPLL